MDVLTHSVSFQALLLQAADEGRGPVLFGDSLLRLREAMPPFLVGDAFPNVYLEHPLIGEPFLDATVLYDDIQPGTRVNSPLAGDHGAMFDWFAAARENHGDICCGFELDTKEAVPPVSAVHFQPRRHQELVRPFCETIGEPEKAELYLEMAQRMPQGWPLSFFGLFRGRPGSPLRVCGYLGSHEKEACANHSAHLASVFDQIGFRAYDDQMLAQVGKLMAAPPSTVDFQFDVYPDGSLGDTFAIDMQFGIQQPEAVWQTFSSGAGADVMDILEDFGAADDRWKRSVRATFARAIPVELPDGGIGRFALTVMPQWVKARWIRGTLQPSKLYMLVNAALVNG